MKRHIFKICGTGAKTKKKKTKKKKKHTKNNNNNNNQNKNSFVSPYPTDPLKMTLTQNIFFIENGFVFFNQNLYFAVRVVFCTILLFLMYFYCKILNCNHFEAFYRRSVGFDILLIFWNSSFRNKNKYFTDRHFSF